MLFLPDALTSCIKLFVDDTKLFGIVCSNIGINRLESDLQSVMNWYGDWEMIITMIINFPYYIVGIKTQGVIVNLGHS